MRSKIVIAAVVTLLGAAAFGVASTLDVFSAEDTGSVSVDGSAAPALSTANDGNDGTLSTGVAPGELGAPENLLYIIYDSSNSMWGALPDNSRKYEVGRQALTSVLASPINRQLLAFRAYGHRSPSDCRDSQLMVVAGNPTDTSLKVSKAVETIRPTGKTPISYSLREALKDFGDRKGDILLISDGIETCDIDPCALMEEWRAKGVNIRVHVVGVGLNKLERSAMACLAEAGGGKYYDAGSEAELIKAIDIVSDIPAGKPKPKEKAGSYRLQLTGTDDQGRSFVVKGNLLQNGKIVKEVSSVGRTSVDKPGDYVVTAGVLLQDGSIYKPVSRKVSIAKPGNTLLELKVTRPAIVSARFSEDGAEHRGSFVDAYQKNKSVFGFRAFDEALVRPGQYEFRANPNQDNVLKVSAKLEESEHKIIDFDLQKTVKFYVNFRLPDGKTIKQHSSLWRNGVEIYRVHSSNGGRAIPGIYQLRMSDPKAPLTKPVNMTIKTDKQVIIVDLPAAFLTVKYTGSSDNLLKKPDRSFVNKYDPQKQKFTGKAYTRINTAVPFAPGRYRVEAHYNYGYFDPVEVNLRAGESKTVKLVAKPLGKVVLKYDPASTFKGKADRAFIRPLDGQTLNGCNCRLDKPHKVPPGHYRAEAHYRAGEFKTQIITVRAGQTTTVTLSNR